MTTAVCYKCGAFKFGAFSPCSKCGAYPGSEEEFMTSFILTDHFNSKDELAVTAKKIEAGGKIAIDPRLWDLLGDQIRQVMRTCGRSPQNPAPSEPSE